MDISRSVRRIFQKPLLLVVVPIVYFFLVIFAKWQLHFSLDALFFFLGGIISIYLLDIAEEVFPVTPSPFRTMLFVTGLGVIGFYIITSTREMIASGLALGLMANIFLFQVSEWKLRKNLDYWYQVFLGNVSTDKQKIGLLFLGIVFLLQTILFVMG